MNRALLLPSAYVLDQLAGDPEWFPHPVRLMGAAITRGERLLRNADDSPMRQFVSGLAFTSALVVSSYYVTRAAIALACRQSRMLGWATEILLAWTCLAARNLEQEAQAVFAALAREDLVYARTRLARIVGRDTHTLDASEISRALIETLAESASDGVVAPMLYLAVGGVPLAMAYKAINTLDSMIGHRDDLYLYFGKAAARLDDSANYVPSRVTALAIVAASALAGRDGMRTSWVVWRRDGDRHKSPNAGQPEAAMAGALRVRLGGDNSYGGELIAAPSMGEEFAPARPDAARNAIRLTMAVAAIGLGVGMLLAACSRRGRA